MKTRRTPRTERNATATLAALSALDELNALFPRREHKATFTEIVGRQAARLRDAPVNADAASPLAPLAPLTDAELAKRNEKAERQNAERERWASQRLAELAAISAPSHHAGSLQLVSNIETLCREMREVLALTDALAFDWTSNTVVHLQRLEHDLDEIIGHLAAQAGLEVAGT